MTIISIDNLYVSSGDTPNLFYIINDKAYDSELQLIHSVPEDITQLPPFNVDTNGSIVIVVMFIFEYFFDVMLYQQNQNGELVELTPRSPGNNTLLDVKTLRVPLPGGHPENPTDNFPEYPLWRIDPTILQQIQDLKDNISQDGVTDQVYDQILNLRSTIYLYRNRNDEIAYYFNNRIYHPISLRIYDGAFIDDIASAIPVIGANELIQANPSSQPILISTLQNNDIICTYGEGTLRPIKIKDPDIMNKVIRRNYVKNFNVPAVSTLSIQPEVLPLLHLPPVDEVVNYLQEEVFPNRPTVRALFQQIPLIPPPPPLFKEAYLEFLRRLYGFPPTEFPRKLVDFSEIATLLNKAQLSRFELDPVIQIWTGSPLYSDPGPPNFILTFYGTTGRVYYSEVRYDLRTNQIFPPLSPIPISQNELPGIKK